MHTVSILTHRHTHWWAKLMVATVVVLLQLLCLGVAPAGPSHVPHQAAGPSRSPSPGLDAAPGAASASGGAGGMGPAPDSRVYPAEVPGIGRRKPRKGQEVGEAPA